MSKYIKWYPYEKNLNHTTGLFLELASPDSKLVPLYTLDHNDYYDPETKKTYLSLRKRYLDFKDPSESAIAEVYFYDHQHWDVACSSPVLEKYIAEWRISLERILQEDAIEKIRSIADGGNFAAAKWLAEKSWKNDLDSRNNLKKKAKEKVLPTADKAEVSEDAKRVLAFIKPRSTK